MTLLQRQAFLTQLGYQAQLSLSDHSPLLTRHKYASNCSLIRVATSGLPSHQNNSFTVQHLSVPMCKVGHEQFIGICIYLLKEMHVKLWMSVMRPEMELGALTAAVV
mmetsp:Transcript_16362/g.34548  ORF Transcript_16362/g.34548 Transcript_16362/m.34548 type:complete len:107 (-) Transcript_16362:35-355(-)